MKDKKQDIYLMGQAFGQLLASGVIGATLLIMAKCSSGNQTRDKDVIHSAVVDKATHVTDSIVAPRFVRQR